MVNSWPQPEPLRYRIVSTDALTRTGKARPGSYWAAAECYADRLDYERTGLYLAWFDEANSAVEWLAGGYECPEEVRAEIVAARDAGIFEDLEIWWHETSDDMIALGVHFPAEHPTDDRVIYTPIIRWGCERVSEEQMRQETVPLDDRSS